MQTLTVAEACRALKVSRTTLWRLQQRGELPSLRVGNGVRILAADLEQFIAARRTVRQPIAEAA
jgi:excisionase family DNA binding protein